MHINIWWIIQNYYNQLVDHVFKSNVTKSHMFYQTKPEDEIPFKNEEKLILHEFFPPNYESDFNNDFDTSSSESD